MKIHTQVERYGEKRIEKKEIDIEIESDFMKASEIRNAKRK